MQPKLTILSTLAVMGVLQDVLPGYADAAVTASYGPTKDRLVEIGNGARADLTILTDTGIDDLIAAGILLAGSRVDLARSFVGVAVRAGAKQPDISTEAAFVQTLLDAKSIAYSATGASGLFFAGLIERLGIAAAVNAKATVFAGLTGTLAASGAVELAVQQVSELMVVPGIDIVGRLPAALHGGAVFSGGVFGGAPPAAMALLRYLASPAVAPVFVRHGVEPVGLG